MSKPRFGFNTHGDVIPLPRVDKSFNVTIIAAMDSQNGIGKNNAIPWDVKRDMQQFKRLTTGHPVIMGRKTFESLGCKPLPNRVNIVITRDPEAWAATHPDVKNLMFFATLSGSLQELELYTARRVLAEYNAGCDHTESDKLRQIFIIGGAWIYDKAIRTYGATDMILTRFDSPQQCDTFFPTFDRWAWKEPTYSTHTLNDGVKMRFEYWRR